MTLFFAPFRYVLRLRDTGLNAVEPKELLTNDWEVVQKKGKSSVRVTEKGGVGFLKWQIAPNMTTCGNVFTNS